MLQNAFCSLISKPYNVGSFLEKFQEESSQILLNNRRR